MSSPHPDRLAVHSRAREIRLHLYGEQGIPALVGALSIPARTWENFEAGASIPAPVILEFLALTGVNPIWLLRGKGEPFSGRSTGHQASN